MEVDVIPMLFASILIYWRLGIVRLVEIPIDEEKDMRLGRYGQGKTGPLLVGINKKILVPGFQGENPAGP